jgi:hypothetical protein
MQFLAPADTRVTYLVTDISGKLMLQNQLVCSEGLNEINLNVQHLQPGTYIVHVRTDRTGLSKKLIITR